MDKRKTKEGFDILWNSTIDTISTSEWEEVFEKKIVKSPLFFKASELATIPDTSFLYLKITRENKVFAIIPCFTYNLSLDILAPTLIKRILKFLRLFFPKLLRIRIFGIGSLASTCCQHIGIRKNISEDDFNLLSNIITNEIKSKAKKLKHRILFLKEVPANKLEEIAKVFKNEFHFYYSLPNCYIPTLRDFSPYPLALKRKERQRIRNMKEKFNKSYRWDLIQDFSEVADIFEKLYLETLGRSKNKFEILNKEYFFALNNLFRDSSFFLAAKNKCDQIEAIGIVLEDTESLTPLYLGLNHMNRVDDIKLLHTNSLLRVVEEAELRGKSYIALGQTSYYSKVLSGAVVEKLYLGFYSYNIFIQFIIKTFFGRLFLDTKVLNNIYSKAYFDKVKEWSSDRGIEICN
ncbi:MAG: hypothetical protein LBR46_03800 [Prevotella sp.]|jgi:hypothetical protein|nr:hypothetical protein [Prevotella sp.]